MFYQKKKKEEKLIKKPASHSNLFVYIINIRAITGCKRARNSRNSGNSCFRWLSGKKKKKKRESKGKTHLGDIVLNSEACHGKASWELIYGQRGLLASPKGMKRSLIGLIWALRQSWRIRRLIGWRGWKGCIWACWHWVQIWIDICGKIWFLQTFIGACWVQEDSWGLHQFCELEARMQERQDKGIRHGIIESSHIFCRTLSLCTRVFQRIATYVYNNLRRWSVCRGPIGLINSFSNWH